jgi:hypothetical protein
VVDLRNRGSRRQISVNGSLCDPDSNPLQASARTEGGDATAARGERLCVGLTSPPASSPCSSVPVGTPNDRALRLCSQDPPDALVWLRLRKGGLIPPEWVLAARSLKGMDPIIDLMGIRDDGSTP